MEDKKVIVYRSRLEKEMDDFWWSDDGQALILWGAIAFLVVVAAYGIYNSRKKGYR